jgi:hypothetical protein
LKNATAREAGAGKMPFIAFGKKYRREATVF